MLHGNYTTHQRTWYANAYYVTFPMAILVMLLWQIVTLQPGTYYLSSMSTLNTHTVMSTTSFVSHTWHFLVTPPWQFVTIRPSKFYPPSFATFSSHGNLNIACMAKIDSNCLANDYLSHNTYTNYRCQLHGNFNFQFFFSFTSYACDTHEYLLGKGYKFAMLNPWVSYQIPQAHSIH